LHIIEFFESDRQPDLIDSIDKGDWRAAQYLASLLRTQTFDTALGAAGKLYMLMDGDALVSFVTLTRKDCIDDDSLFPWLGFFYTFPAYRGHRYGGKLLSHAAREARRMGYACVYLATDHIGLYEKYGFTYWENRMGVWGDEERIYIRRLDAGLE